MKKSILYIAGNNNMFKINCDTNITTNLETYKKNKEIYIDIDLINLDSSALIFLKNLNDSDAIVNHIDIKVDDCLFTLNQSRIRSINGNRLRLKSMGIMLK